MSQQLSEEYTVVSTGEPPQGEDSSYKPVVFNSTAIHPNNPTQSGAVTEENDQALVQQMKSWLDEYSDSPRRSFSAFSKILKTLDYVRRALISASVLADVAFASTLLTFLVELTHLVIKKLTKKEEDQKEAEKQLYFLARTLIGIFETGSEVIQFLTKHHDFVKNTSVTSGCSSGGAILSAVAAWIYVGFDIKALHRCYQKMHTPNLIEEKLRKHDKLDKVIKKNKEKINELEQMISPKICFFLKGDKKIEGYLKIPNSYIVRAKQSRQNLAWAEVTITYFDKNKVEHSIDVAEITELKGCDLYYHAFHLSNPNEEGLKEFEIGRKKILQYHARRPEIMTSTKQKDSLIEKNNTLIERQMACKKQAIALFKYASKVEKIKSTQMAELVKKDFICQVVAEDISPVEEQLAEQLRKNQQEKFREQIINTVASVTTAVGATLLAVSVLAPPTAFVLLPLGCTLCALGGGIKLVADLEQKSANYFALRQMRNNIRKEFLQYIPGNDRCLLTDQFVPQSADIATAFKSSDFSDEESIKILMSWQVRHGETLSDNNSDSNNAAYKIYLEELSTAKKKNRNNFKNFLDAEEKLYIDYRILTELLKENLSENSASIKEKLNHISAKEKERITYRYCRQKFTFFKAAEKKKVENSSDSLEKTISHLKPC